ncbi:hypothetical protein EVAR_50834_1 [Eumeta japonica]|uniref:Uncharacterized protein n=1 Tax=Eumeta variegata TaxID=151549 RepID=A0A4C1XEE5_EUMVA|nr:hypothetical protein EVAR_50834_1 [Eumeta japonica]
MTFGPPTRGSTKPPPSIRPLFLEVIQKKQTVSPVDLETVYLYAAASAVAYIDDGAIFMKWRKEMSRGIFESIKDQPGATGQLRYDIVMSNLSCYLDPNRSHRTSLPEIDAATTAVRDRGPCGPRERLDAKALQRREQNSIQYNIP